MKRIFSLLLITILTAGIMYASNNKETFTFKSTQYAVKEYDAELAQWSDWSELEDDQVLIVYNFKKLFVEVFSNVKQEYHVVGVKFLEEENLLQANEYNPGIANFDMECVDETGEKLNLKHRMEDGITKLYIEFPTVQVVYYLKGA